MKNTLIVGAHPDPTRYAYMAAQKLSNHGHDFVPIGIKKGSMYGKEIIDLKTMPRLSDIHTITLYINPTRQAEWQEYLLSLKPKRIIFNPGTENHAFKKRAEQEGIEATYACTLVMLSSSQY